MHAPVESSRSAVTVVIPCRNESDYLEPLLDALRVQDWPHFEILVVDNGSTDDSPAIVEAYARRHPDLPLRLLHCAKEGPAAALNAGIAQAAGQIIVRLDGHSRPRPDYVRKCVTRLAEPRAGVVGGLWDIQPGGPTLTARAIALAVGAKLGSGGAAYRHPDAHRGTKDVDTVPFGCFRRDLWQELRGYDDSLLVAEDGEFNYRVRRAGFRVILDSAIRSTYFPRRRFRTLARQYLRYGWWKVPMLLRHPGAIRIRQIVPLGFVATVMVLAFAGIWSAAATTLLLIVMALYGAAILTSGALIAIRCREWRIAAPVAAAFAVIHFAWGIGGLLHLASFGRYPQWRLRAKPPAVT